MRVISGALRGRNFVSPHSDLTHPMSDKIRNALFNTLGDIEGLTVLDCFAGTGALSFEAISRGATSALAIEQDRLAQQTIERSIKDLSLQSSVRLTKAGCSNWSEGNTHKHFDLVLADPPYDHVQLPVLEKMTRHVMSGGLFVLSFPVGEQPPEYEAFELVSHKAYGEAQLLFYRAA